MDWTPFTQAMLTVITGVIVFATSQIIIKYYVDPVNQLSKAIGEALQVVFFYDNIATNPPGPQMSKDERKLRNQASNSLRHAAASLSARAACVRWYGVSATFRVLPKKENIERVIRDLTLLSNSCFLNRDPEPAFRASEEVRLLLNRRQAATRINTETERTNTEAEAVGEGAPLQEEIDRIDKHFETGLLLVSILSAAVLAYASFGYSLKASIDLAIIPNPTNETLTPILSRYLPAGNYVFRATTIPIGVAILVWLFKEIVPCRWESVIPLRRWMKEYSWGTLSYLLFIDFLLIVFLSFMVTVEQLTIPVLTIGLTAFIMSFLVTYQYKKFQNPLRNRDRRFSLEAFIESVIINAITYLSLYVLLWAFGATLTPL